LLLSILAGAWLPAQTIPESRQQEIAAAQQEKASHPPPVELEKSEILFDKYVSPVVSRLFAPRVGWTARLGGLMSGSGFALGPQYSRPDLAGEKVNLQASLVGSFKQYWAAAAMVSMPHIAGDRVKLDLFLRHADSPSVDYYGAGPNSRRENRANYREETTSFDSRLTWKPDRRHVNLGFYGGYVMFNTGPGQRDEAPSIETRFTPREAPGLDQQSYFLRYGPYAEIDYRDKPGDAHRGGNYVARLLQFDDRRFGLYSFRRFDGWTEQYVPFFNEKRVLAFRAATQLTWTDRGQSVPFYLQPTIGDANDFRGYSRFRFRDNNSLVLSSEYRWEVATPLDMAVFVDAGRVFDRPSALGLNNLKYTGGFGFRAKTRDTVVMRLDLGFSKEGWQLWFKFYNAFARDLFRYLF
jgi:outer membrane protein assembly factor BamA